MPTLVLAALFASAWNPARAWSDRAGWGAAPQAVLAGVGGAETEPAAVRARWNEEWFFFEFTCRDRSVVSPGRADGEDHFKIGDVVEIFLGREGQAAYLEAHATPAARKAVYSFFDRRAAAPGHAPDGVVVRAGRTEGGWRAVLSIPRKLLGGGPHDGWEFLAGRYDYDEPGGRPSLSSFPAQTGKPDFHNRGSFARLELCP